VRRPAIADPDQAKQAARSLSAPEARTVDPMTSSASRSEPAREDAARRLLERVRLRAEANEAVGILQIWHACRRDQARDDLDVTGTAEGQEGEARRIIAVVNDAADGRADPDARWD
jgi:hypothetical protein